MELQIKTGAVVIPVKDEYGELIGEIKVSPTDTDITSRLVSVQKDFDEYVKSMEMPEEVEKKNEFITNFSNYVREKFDYIFNAKVSNILFKICSPLTIVDNDGTYACLYILDQMKSVLDEVFKERLESLQRIEEATKDYN